VFDPYKLHSSSLNSQDWHHIEEKDTYLGPSSPRLLERAEKAVLSLAVMNLTSWTRIHLYQNSQQTVPTVCISARCFGVATILNPCRVFERCSVVNYGKRDGSMGKVSLRACYFRAATLSGHVLQGEEYFCVYRKPHRRGNSVSSDDGIWFRQYSRSKPSGALGSITWPLIRILQKRFFAQQAAEFKNYLQMEDSV
jgi:uncharacterized protein (UPF0548 family)